MSDDKSLYLIDIILQICYIGNDHIDSRHTSAGKIVRKYHDNQYCPTYWKAVMFIPICSRPPKGMIFRPETLLFSFFFFNEITSKFYTSIQLFLVYVSRR